MEKIKKIVVNVLLLLFTFFLFFIMAEIFTRFYLFGWDSLSIEKMNSVHNIGYSGMLQRSTYPDVICELKPNIDVYHKLVRVKTNSQGLIDKEYSIKKPENTFRVTVIGDSYTMPEGVEMEDAYHSVIEERLNKEKNDMSYEFIAFSNGAYSLREYVAVMKHKALKYDPDLILIGFCSWNDFRYSPKREMDAYKPKEVSYPFYESFLRKIIRKRLFIARKYRYKEFFNWFKSDFNWLKSDEVKKNVGKKGQTKKKNKNKNRNVDYMKEMFTEMSTISNDRNIPIVVAYLAIKPKNYKPVQDIVTETGLFFIDTSSAFEGKEYFDHIIYRSDDHPNWRANKIFADVIYDYLKEKKFLHQTVGNSSS